MKIDPRTGAPVVVVATDGYGLLDKATGGLRVVVGTSGRGLIDGKTGAMRVTITDGSTRGSTAPDGSRYVMSATGPNGFYAPSGAWYVAGNIGGGQGGVILPPLPEGSFAHAYDGGEDIDLTTLTAFFTKSGTEYTAASNTSGFGAYGVSSHFIPQGFDGYVEMDTPTTLNYSSLIGLDVNAANQTHGNNDYNAYISASTFNVQRLNNTTTATNTGVNFPAAANNKMRLERRGTNMLLRLSNDAGNTWRTIQTFTNTPDANQYAHFTASANMKATNPKGATLAALVPGFKLITPGNSQTFGTYPSGSFITSGYGWPQMIGDLAEAHGLVIQNVAVSGQTTSGMQTNLATQVTANLSETDTNIVCFAEGRNHLYQTGSVLGCYDALMNYADSVRSAGADIVIIGGVLPNDITLNGETTTTAGDSAATFADKLNELDTMIREGWPSEGLDGYVDFRLAPELATVTPQIYPDGIHPVSLGSALMRDLEWEVIREFIF